MEATAHSPQMAKKPLWKERLSLPSLLKAASQDSTRGLKTGDFGLIPLLPRLLAIQHPEHPELGEKHTGPRDWARGLGKAVGVSTCLQPLVCTLTAICFSLSTLALCPPFLLNYLKTRTG